MLTLHSMVGSLAREIEQVLSSAWARLILAALLGGVIGLERQLRHRTAGLRTNMFICMGAAMFTLLSKQLAEVPADSTRIAAQIIPGIGFIGAGSILHARGSVTGLTTAATIFVVASVGMAVGGGLYVTGIFATILILIVLAVIGKLEAHFQLFTVSSIYEVTGGNVEAMLREIKRILEEEKLTMRSIQLSSLEMESHVIFAVDAVREDQANLSVRLHDSNAFNSVKLVSGVEHE